MNGIDGFPEIIEVAKLEHERVNFGGIWHSDTTYLPAPPMGTLLVAREVPPVGGDTLFANQYLAYEALSERMRAMLDGLTAVSTSAKADVTPHARGSREERGNRPGARGTARPSTRSCAPIRRPGARRCIVNLAHTQRFAGMTEEESAGLLDFLFRHQVRPEFTCRFRWEVGSLAFWDNRCAQHNPINDYHGYRRVMHRITLAGDRPR